jgi:hypothetical protein
VDTNQGEPFASFQSFAQDKIFPFVNIEKFESPSFTIDKFEKNEIWPSSNAGVLSAKVALHNRL